MWIAQVCNALSILLIWQTCTIVDRLGRKGAAERAVFQCSAPGMARIPAKLVPLGVSGQESQSESAVTTQQKRMAGRTPELLYRQVAGWLVEFADAQSSRSGRPARR